MWLAVHPVGEWVGERLGLDKRPFQWFYRPRLWPAWNPAFQRLVRVWIGGEGLDTAAEDVLSTGGSDGLMVAEPTVTEVLEQFGVELAVARRHLHAVLECLPPGQGGAMNVKFSMAGGGGEHGPASHA